MTLRSIELLSHGRRWRADLSRAASIAVPLDFAGPQLKFFGAPAASSMPLKVAGFVGDIDSGGSCRCATLTLTPHCNGTHTECIGHVAREVVSIHTVASEALLLACLISVEPAHVTTTPEAKHPAAQPGDLMITADSLRRAIPVPLPADCTALVIRSLPNPPDKQTRHYDLERDMPPYLSVDAMAWIVAQDFSHLVVDLPSVDRAVDQGRLLCHRLFWALPEGSTSLAEARRAHATLTELAYIGNDVPDGLYLLNLQLPAFVSDAAPSRPVLYPLQALDP